MVRTALLLFLSLTLFAQDPYRKLPDWAATVARSAQAEPAPEQADAWVLQDRTEIAYTGGGEIRQRRFRLVKVLTERGREQRTFALRGLGGKASRVKKLKGWNLRPDGEMVKLDQDEVVTINDAGSPEFSTESLTGASLDRVVPGSLIAFESLETIESPLGPVAGEGILESSPIRHWELEVAKKEGWFTDLKAVTISIEKRHFTPWISTVEETPGARLALSNLPALPKDEEGHPDLGEILPSVRVRFQDPDLPLSRMWGSWNELAVWTAGNYQAKRRPAVTAAKGWSGAAGLEALWSWMGKSLTYKQIYLTPERGWLPEASDEVGRKKYGDCKDLSCFLLSEASSLGYRGFPALASISNPEVDSSDAPFPEFNHVITALKLKRSLGFPAEVETPVGRFLLVDPTDPLVPLGRLGAAHRGRNVMICLDTCAQWVRVPDAAIQPNRLELDLDGEARLDGRLVATLQIDETGSAWGLRAVVRARGAKGVHDRLVQDLLDIPPTGTLVVTELGDPLELAKAFRVTVRVEHPQGYRANGAERELVGWGFPWPRTVIQKSGVPRRFPVQARTFGERILRARLKVPERAQPVVPKRTVETAFSTFSVEAVSEPAGSSSKLTLLFQHRWKDADFGFDQREAGVQAWKKDRNLYKAFREDALAFKIVL
ncbi:hypothetical protein [Geothrix fuzhouensis]|uniref:hypothetical protein n=1 Tax=Geothrix fuzhouensis TaxID=2966451 RepID=UPI002148167F|nr:hypothetical protein [Geothrix fuzhouensis]